MPALYSGQTFNWMNSNSVTDIILVYDSAVIILFLRAVNGFLKFVGICWHSMLHSWCTSAMFLHTQKQKHIWCAPAIMFCEKPIWECQIYMDVEIIWAVLSIIVEPKILLFLILDILGCMLPDCKCLLLLLFGFWGAFWRWHLICLNKTVP